MDNGGDYRRLLKSNLPVAVAMNLADCDSHTE